MRTYKDQTWEEFEADPRNHLRFVGSVRILSDSQLSNEAKLMAFYMTLRDFDANEIDSIADFFNDSMTPIQIVKAALELFEKGYAFEPKNRSLALFRHCDELGWRNQNGSK